MIILDLGVKNNRYETRSMRQEKCKTLAQSVQALCTKCAGPLHNLCEPFAQLVQIAARVFTKPSLLATSASFFYSNMGRIAAAHVINIILTYNKVVVFQLGTSLL